MHTYTVTRLDAPLPALAGEVFDPDAEPFCRRAFAAIDRYRWGGAYRPEARAYVAWDDGALYALLCAKEATISIKARTFGGEVCKDSCLEWFLRPFDGDPRYLNIEINAAGAALIGLGEDREHRTALPRCPDGMDIRASAHAGGWWAVAYRLPFAVLDALFGRCFDPAAPLWVNFYKCDESIHPHFGSWNPVEAPQPDFHRPECFGRMVLI